MGSFSIWHWLIVLAVVLVLFGGGGKISGMMGDFGKGLKSFKKNMSDDGDASMEAATTDKQNGTISGPGTVGGANANTGTTSANAARHV